MYTITEFIINMNGNFQGEILIDQQYPFQGKYEFYQDEIYLTNLYIVDENSNFKVIPKGLMDELRQEIKKYHGK